MNGTSDLFSRIHAFVVWALCTASMMIGLAVASKETALVVHATGAPIFAVGAVFNATYTLSHGTELYRSFADGAWLPPARTMIEKVVIPNATAVTVALILFQATVAVLILARGDLVQPALVAGGVVALVAAAASSPGGTVANLALAAGLLILALTR